MRRLRSDLDLGELSRLIPAVGVALVWTVLMFRIGGYRPGTWLPAGLVLLALLVLAVIGERRLLPADRRARTALLLLAAFTGWCFLSIAWSDGRGPAWEAANLLLVALLGTWTLALMPWRTRTAALFMVLLSVAAAAACIAAMLSALNAADLTTRFVDFRFAPPLDYPNSSAAFAFMAALPALLLAARPDATLPARALAQGLATFLCAYGLMPQSRGAILGGLAAVAILFLAVPFRWRLFGHVALLAVGLAAVAGPAGDVYSSAAETGVASDALRDAFTAMLIVSGLAIAAGAGLAAVEDRVAERADEYADLGRRAAIAGAVIAVLAVVGAGLAKSATISDTLGDQWRALKHPGEDFGGTEANASENRLISTDPLERYDYWRVALDGFASNPIGGMGAGGFEHRYALERRYPKPSRYPHNLVMKVLGDTGIVGLGLMIAFLVVITRGLVISARRRTTRERVVAAGAAATLGYFLAHGLFDWLEAYPVLAGPAFGFSLIALVVRGRADHERAASRGLAPPVAPAAPRRRAGAWVPAAAVALLAALSLLAPWLAVRYRERAAGLWRTDPVSAYQDLDRAASLNPFSDQADLLRGAIALTRGDAEIARDGFADALDREETWLPHFGLAVLAAADGDRATAERELALAEREHPEDPVLPEVAERVLARGEIDPAELLRQVLTNSRTAQDRVS